MTAALARVSRELKADTTLVFSSDFAGVTEGPDTTQIHEEYGQLTSNEQGQTNVLMITDGKENRAGQVPHSSAKAGTVPPEKPDAF